MSDTYEPPDYDPTKAEAFEAVRMIREEQLAVMFAMSIQLAAERFPEEVRKAIGQVFDVSALLDGIERVSVMQNRVEKAAHDLRDTLHALQIQTDQVAQAFEANEHAINLRFEQLDARLNKAARLYNASQKKGDAK